MKICARLAALVFCSSLFSLPVSASCNVWISSVTHRDNVTPTVDVTFNMGGSGCTTGSNLELWLDGSKSDTTTASTKTDPLTLSTTTNNPHRVLARVTDSTGTTVETESQILSLEAVDPATLGTGYTAVVNIWNPTGCPSTNQSCSWKEKIPTGTFYVDAKVYSNLNNITKVSIYLDFALVGSDDNLANENSHTIHSAALSVSTAGSHRLTVQALSGTTVVGQLTTYFDAENVLGSGFDGNGGAFLNTDDTTPSFWETCPTGVECRGMTAPVHSTTIDEDGQSMKFTSDSGAWEQAFWTLLWNDVSGLPPNGNSPVKYVRFWFDAYVDSGLGDGNSPNALEFQVEQRRTGEWIRNFALQDAYNETGTWRTYDFAAQNGVEGKVQSWQPSNVPYLPLTKGCWYRFVMDFHSDTEDPSHPLYRDDALWAYPISGTNCSNPYGTARQAFSFHNAHESQTQQTTKSEITDGISLDTNGSGAVYHMYTDKMNVTLTQ
jgi:hypothetical protein